MEKGLKNLQNANRTLVKKERNQPVQEDGFNDSGLPMDDTATNNATDVSSEMGRDDQHPFLDASDEHIQAHSGRGEEQQQQQQQQSSSYSHNRDSQMSFYPTEIPSSTRSYTPHRTFSTTSSASTFTPVSATSTTLPPIRSSFFANILQSNPVTTH